MIPVLLFVSKFGLKYILNNIKVNKYEIKLACREISKNIGMLFDV